MFSIADNLDNVRLRIKKSAARLDRNADEISLLAVTKTRDANVLATALSAGLSCFGENYVNEAIGKQEDLARLCSPEAFRHLKWHFIGPVQSNKTRLIAEHFDWVQSVDRLKIAERLNDQRGSEQSPLNICIQVNISNEQSKSGLELQEIEALSAHIASLPRLRLRGLMAIPMLAQSPDQLRESFKMMHKAFETLKCHYPDVDTLSMGMSSDIESAIECGATMVRVGTALFGERTQGRSSPSTKIKD